MTKEWVHDPMIVEGGAVAPNYSVKITDGCADFPDKHDSDTEHCWIRQLSGGSRFGPTDFGSGILLHLTCHAGTTIGDDVPKAAGTSDEQYEMQCREAAYAAGSGVLPGDTVHWERESDVFVSVVRFDKATSKQLEGGTYVTIRQFAGQEIQACHTILSKARVGCPSCLEHSARLYQRFCDKTVILTGLISKPQWNGMSGAVVAYDCLRKRFHVCLDSGESAAVKHSNLLLKAEAHTPASA
jgi:hypothetical protein